MQEKILQRIKELINKNNFDFPINEARTLQQLCLDLTADNVIGFYVSDVNCGDDYWLQADYYSQAIGKTIVLDNDYQGYFETPEELAESLAYTQNEMLKLEAKLTAMNAHFDTLSEDDQDAYTKEAESNK